MDDSSLTLFRMLERLTLTAVILGVSLVVMVGFWRTVTRVDLSDGGKLGVAGSVTLATPVFVLLGIVGYAWVSLSNPLKVERSDGSGSVTFLGPDGVELDRDALLRELFDDAVGADASTGLAPGTATPPEDRENDLARLQEKLWAINCAARDTDLGAAVSADLIDAKLALMAPL